MSRLDDMVRGYLKGLDSPGKTLPECYDRESLAFKHGWHNGRDDRMGLPRDAAEVLSKRAQLILDNCA